MTGMAYTLLKDIHVTCAVTTICLFSLRGWWMYRGSPMLNRRWVRITPHIVDTTLLASALALAWTIRQYPFVNGWLTAKLLALFLYIGLGTLALKRGRTRKIRTLSLILALGTFGYIVSVAFTKTPTPWIRLWH